MHSLPFLKDIDLNKPYDPQQVEQPLYAWWETSGFFAPDPQASRPPFVISIPPPNVTGELHLGHAMCVAIEDLMIRWRRMQGHQTLWVPGADHAGIATQLQVERMLVREGTSRKEIGRAEFLRRTWEWKEKYGGEIFRQLRRMGASCDWSRQRFTLDEGLSRAVHTAFKRLYDDGLIYRGTYLVNWSPNLGTAVSDLEVEYETRQGLLWFVRYPLLAGPDSSELPVQPWGSGQWAAGATEYLTVATTRPETMLGDTAVAVNPTDERYAHLIGRFALLPAIGRRIPIIADEYVDKEFGTGAVKITPAHDPNDYEMGKRHNLPMINIMNPDASLNAEAGPYQGMDRFDARKALVADIEREGLLAKVEPHTLNISISQRGGEVVEPLLSVQWFVRTQTLADMALASVREGRTRIIPEHFEKVYIHWLEHIKDWCISRQLWWGHRIPVWYTPDGQMVVPGPDETPPAGATQDPDVLDTWFSSGLWPFSTLGWPDETDDVRTFYPTSVMETAYDILFFWVARMMMMGDYLTGVEPFHTVYLHGLVRDEHGRKMSKTHGNVVNPLSVTDTYGTDALRFTLATSGTPGQDLNLNPQRIEAARNFANKLWNITRFVINCRSRSPAAARPALAGASSDALTLADRWILSRYHRLVADVDRLLEGYNFGEAGRQIHDFLWNEFADWYIEVAKVQLEASGPHQEQTAAVLSTVLEGSLRLLHPFMPYVTEAAWQFLTGDERPAASTPRAPTVMYAPYPVADGSWLDAQAEADFLLLQELVTGVRNVRNEYRVEPARRVAAVVVAGPHTSMMQAEAPLLGRLARIDAERLTVVEHLPEKPDNAATLVVGTVEVFLPLAGMVDLEAERTRLGKELQAVEEEMVRREQRLAREDFVQKAPAHVVQKERDSLSAAQATAERLRERLAAL
ncbi:MAG: valine--tRNA ligase [Chloroflexaceae bacterium]|nr:valine--tRNA ligase [Chloroflexaceae bacterium]